MRRAAPIAVSLLVVTLLPLTGKAAPTCTGPTPAAACGGRVMAEPLQTVTFLQYGSEAFPALQAIEAVAPDLIQVSKLADLTGNPKHVSANGLDIPVVRVTDESKTGPKRKVVFSLSVHANEPAGREGGIRYIEDLARWWTSDKKHPLYAGDTAVHLDDVMAQTEVWFCICNPDGWAYGDLGNQHATFQRANGAGADLNREFPTLGWTNTSATPMSETEAQGWVQFVSSLGPVSTSSDIHGELTSASSSFSDLMWAAGQWTPKFQARELQLGDNVVKTIERKFAADGVVLGTLTGLTGAMKPASAATGYDVVGYDDGGFMGDWFTQKAGAVDIDAENFLSHMAPGNVWLGTLEQAHVAAVRGIVEAVIAESMITDAVRPKLDLGRVAYVFDPRHVTSADGTGGGPTKPYDSNRMQYFADLAADAGVPVTAVDPADIASGAADLSAFDSLVLADVVTPPDRLGRTVNQTRYVDALRAFATGGGQLVLTDSAVTLLKSFGFNDEGALQTARTNAGHVDFGTRDHDWEQDVSATASQTYYEVPLGFPPTNSAPHYGVTQTAWDGAGGTTVGTVTPSGGTAFTALGELPQGQGKVSIFGALLPTATEENDHEEGLADYGVTIAGGQVFHRMLAYRRPGSSAVPPVTPHPRPHPMPMPDPLPATGADAAEYALLLTAVLGVAVARRRRRAARGA